MTDAPFPPGSPDDELVSAVLDDAATDAERARVAADPRLRARLAELRRARDAIAAPVPVADAVRDDAIAAAIAELGGASASPGDDGADGAGEAAMVARHRTRNRVLVALSLAAVVVLAVVVPVAVSRVGGSRQDAAASAPAGRKPAADQRARADGPGGAPSAAASAPSTTATALPRATVAPDSPAVVAASFLGDDLGTVVDATELRQRVAARFLLRDDVHAADGEAHAAEGDSGSRAEGDSGSRAEGDSGSDTHSAEDLGDERRAATAMPAAPPGTYLPPEAQPEIVARLQACDPQIRNRERGLGVVLFTASVSYGGVPALTFLYDGAPDAANRLVTVDRATCATLDRQPSPR